LLRVRFTHRLLAGVIGAQRPSVSKALNDLARQRRILRRPDGFWLLCGNPPDELQTVHEQTVGPVRTASA
jgi:hypothetical protein